VIRRGKLVIARFTQPPAPPPAWSTLPTPPPSR
jgi:hypothetical protein